MAFSIDLIQNNSDKNVVSKDLTTLLSVSGVLKNETSIIDPVIMIECDLSGLTNANYIHIPVFGRYYYINNIRSIRNGLVEFTCHVDVLQSFASDIKANTGIVRRQENAWNLYLNDGSFKVYQNPMVLTREFPTGFNTHEFVLAVAGS